MAQFQEYESRDGVRFAWNVLPDSSIEATRMAVPPSCLYTPLAEVEGLMTVPYAPVFCKTAMCKAVLNPYCRVDFVNKVWICPFCTTRNTFPQNYAEISNENRPAEIHPQCTTLEYQVDVNSVHAPAFVFVVDTCIIEEELKQLKACLVQSLSYLPEDALVGLVTVGRNVHVHELTATACPKAYVIRGDKKLDMNKVGSLLGLRTNATQKSPSTSQFLMPVAECHEHLTAILEDLSRDQWPVKSTQRPQTATGTGIGVAIGLLETIYAKKNARIMCFIGGPPTVGSGAVASLDAKEVIRSHHDILKGKVPLYQPAMEYYSLIAAKAALNEHVIDLFGCSLDQVGLAEMRVLPEKTGGAFVLDDSFTRGVFIQSFMKLFEKSLRDENVMAMNFGAQLQVQTSRELKVCGAIGHLSKMERKSNCVSDNEIGIGGTCAWRIGGCDSNSTVAVYYDVVAPTSQPASDQQVQGYFQYVTKYRNSVGATLLRVTTVAKTFANPTVEPGTSWIKAGFDQEAAAVLMARYATYKTQFEYTFDILRWIDRMLIRLVSKFATFTKDQISSFRLPPELSYYPQFMFHLRRSQFLQVFNSSPDETAFFRSNLLREHCAHSIVMIQPSLIAFSLDSAPGPVGLDVDAMSPQRILLLDTYFHLVVWYGSEIALWIEQKVQDMPEYAHFGALLEAPKEEAENLVGTRFPSPRFIECIEGGSQARFLVAKLNPSKTQSNMNMEAGEPPVFTEDVNLTTFVDHLRRLVVES